ncbi:hypothetical protein Taro_033401 [Colocasia esculenta]|uniref:RWD domain-containing protein n=1 Tax=Colocasia esculenta TaxID=4460 RepID=A0A843VXT2_COLES|nr:hypothetical protein [Colocasia esculenta]
MDINPGCRINSDGSSMLSYRVDPTCLHITAERLALGDAQPRDGPAGPLHPPNAMAGATEEGEVLAEVEAMQAVYGEDCRVLRPFPPHLDVYIRPRTADDSSQQFVEAILGIRAGAQYPDEPPCIILVESKGLDEKRQEHLTAVLQNKAQVLSSCLMLVALCEEAVEVLSNMNHPEGNCPLCLYPLFREDATGLPFMKLMSCFHCFHSECILGWWKWLQRQTGNNVNNQIMPTRQLESQRGTHVSINQSLGNCPVCRMVFHAKDIEHVLHLLETCTAEEVCTALVLKAGGYLCFTVADIDRLLLPQLLKIVLVSSYITLDLISYAHQSFEVTAPEDVEIVVLQSDVESTRRQKFEALLNLQREKSGLIEPKKDLVVVPGMFLPDRVTRPAVSSGDNAEHIEGGPTNEMVAGDSNNASSKPTMNVHKHTNMRRGRAHNPRKHPNAPASRKQWSAQPSRKQWIKKDNDMDY